jgi:hypothetical protein
VARFEIVYRSREQVNEITWHTHVDLLQDGELCRALVLHTQFMPGSEQMDYPAVPGFWRTVASLEAQDIEEDVRYALHNGPTLEVARHVLEEDVVHRARTQVGQPSSDEYQDGDVVRSFEAPGSLPPDPSL